MAQTKAKAVFTAEPQQLREIQERVHAGLYRSTSEFLREAIREKLARIRRDELTRQVARYCEENACKDEDLLIDAQAFDEVTA